MKIVINKQYGGFGLSATATKRFAEMNGRECYFYESVYPRVYSEPMKYKTMTLEDADKTLFWTAFDIPNVTESVSNEWYVEHSINYRDIERHDPKLIEIVETLGEKANGDCSTLVIVEIPDGVEYVIDEYDGMESVHEAHRVWG